MGNSLPPMDSLTLSATTRTVTGKQVKTLRHQGIIPAVVYGHDKISQSLSIRATDFKRVFAGAGSSTLVDLIVDDAKPVKVLIHEPQIHPVKPDIVHADLYVVKMNEKLQTEIPLEFIGESSAVTDLDGTLTIVLDALEVECFPDKLVHAIEVDITSLVTLEDMIRVSDIKAPEGIEFLADPEEVVATITPPRSEAEMAELEETVSGEDADKAAVEAVEVLEEKKDEEPAE